jgi:translocation and assembly module TamB
MTAMSPRQRRFWWVAAILLGMGAGLGLGVFALTRTEAGRRRLAATLAAQATGVFNGRGSLRIGVLREIGMGRVVAEEVALLDTAGVPVVTAARVEGTLDVRGLFNRAIHIRSLALQGLVLDLRQDVAGRPWNIAYLIAGDTTPSAPRTQPGFGDDVRIDTIVLTDGVVTTRAPWAPHPVFTGRARDSVIAVRDSLHDLVQSADGSWFERRRITLGRVRARDAVIVDRRQRPSALVLDTVVGVISDPPIALRHAEGRVTWTPDSLRLDLPLVRLPSSTASAVGAITWREPGPVRYDVLVKADAGLSDLTWMWDVLPAVGRGTATVRLRTLADADDAEYALSRLDVQSGRSRIRGAITVTVRPAELLLHDVDLTFAPLRSEVLRRISYGALPPEIDGTLTGRLLAKTGGPLTRFRLDRLDARFVDDAVRGGEAVSAVQVRGMLALGAAPRAWRLAADGIRLDLRTVRALSPTAPVVDGIVTGSLTVREADLDAVDLSDVALTWTDAAGNASTVRGEVRARYAAEPLAMQAALTFDPLSLAALARVDTTFTLRSRLAGRVTINGALDSLDWTARLRALEARAVPLGTAADALPDAALELTGTAVVQARAWRATAAGALRAFDLRTWLGREDVPATDLQGTLRLAGAGPLNPSTVSRTDTAAAPAFTSGGVVDLRQVAGDERPAFALLGEARLDAQRLVVDSALLSFGGVRAEVRGALARDSLGVDTLQVAVRTDTLDLLRPQLERLAGMLQPMDSTLAASLRSVAADTLRGDATASGYLYGSLTHLDATAAVGARDLQVGAIRADRLFGSVRARDVLRAPTFEGAANADEVTGLGAVRVQAASFRVSDASPDSGRLVLDVSTDDNAHLVVRGGYAAEGATTRVLLDSLRLSYDGVAWRTDSLIEVVRDTIGVRLAPFTLRSSVGGLLRGEADVPRTGPVRGGVRLERFPVGELSALLAGTPPLTGTLTGRADLGGSRAAPRIAWDIAGDSLGMGGLRLPQVTSTGDYADRRLVARAQLRDSLGGMLRAEGRVPLDLAIATVDTRLLSDRMEGEIVADSLRLDAVPIAIDGVRRLRGRLAGQLALDGTVDRPTARGIMVLEEAGARLDDLGIEPSEGRLVLRAAADSLILESLRVRSGSRTDTLGARGTLHFAAGDSARVAVQVSAHNFEVSRQRNGTDLDIGGVVSVRGAVRRPVVSGNLLIPLANLVVDPLGARAALDLSSAGARELLGAEEVPVAETAAQSLAALGRVLTVTNARVELGNEVWVQTPEARVKLSGGLDVTRRGDELALDGEILANRGQYRLDLGVVNRSFSVDSGRVRFFANAKIPPTLDISATNVVRVLGGAQIPVRVHIGGNYEVPVLTLSSSDPLYASAPESEIISLLIFGAPTFALDGQRQSTVRAVTGVLLPTVGGAMEGALQRLLPGLSTLQVTTAGGQTQGNLNAFSLLDNLSISAGKQVGERTFLRLNTGVCRGAGQADQRGASLWYGIAAEYRVARNWMGQVGMDPGASPCTRLGGDVLPRMQFGFDLFREWIW